MHVHRLNYRRIMNVFRDRGWAVLLGAGLGCTPLHAGLVGGLELAGDRGFDSDRLAVSGPAERRWLSFPGSQLCLNPSSGDFHVPATPANVALDVGGYVGTEVLRLPNVVTVGLASGTDATAIPEQATAQHTTWYPYKLTLEAAYAEGEKVSACDFFEDAQSTLVRVIQLQNAGGKSLVLGGHVPGQIKLSWDGQNHALLATGSNYSYALVFARLEGDSWRPQVLGQPPTLGDNSWRLDLPQNTGQGCYGVSFGFAAGKAGGPAAVQRASKALARPVQPALANVKAAFDTFLRKVPLPTHWGLQMVPALGVTPEQQRQEYYMAWTFINQSLIGSLPENPAYPYPQISLGKSALWSGGEHSSPATCGWESFLGIQWLSFVDPQTAWQAYEGIMSLVDDQGRLGGESLPSRKAQTAWVLYQQQPDQQRLAAVYPAIKRYLLWREQNPRWIFGGNNAPDEKDIEFVVSWILDTGYAAQIADALGKPDDAAAWRSKIPPMIANMRQWFFSDPRELHQFYFTRSGKYSTEGRNEVRPVMILTALNVCPLPAGLGGRLLETFARIHQPAESGDGFNYLKYPDNNLVAYGLIEHGITEAQPFIEAVLRDCIRGGEFAEVVEKGAHGPMTSGVKPSLFNAMNIIEFTWLLNEVRYDSGRPVKCPLPACP